MRTTFRLSRVFPLLLIFALLPLILHARGTSRDLGLVLVIDGTPTHDVGELLLHTSNWGMFGSWPGASFPFSHAPSGEWPAGSGIEYVFTGGLWIGALKGGVPVVSTAAYSFEWRPTQDPVDVVYYSARGDVGGSRVPSVHADDDGDGQIDEDWRDGRDNDLDGLIDEDFAAISDQMLSRWYTDDQPIASEIYPDHRPMGLTVREESYQWDKNGYDDFVGFTYWITHNGTEILNDVYIGIFLDGDVGNRNVRNYWSDDAADFTSISVSHGAHGKRDYDFYYQYDEDGDAGAASGYFGVLILDHPTDPAGATAPLHVGASGAQTFGGTQPPEDGGDPTNDFERYELLAAGTVDRHRRGDVRGVISVGPFAEISPGETIQFSMALVATPRDNDWDNLVRAARAFHGKWFDLDNDAATGVAGKEHQEHWYLSGEARKPRTAATAVDTEAADLRQNYPNPFNPETVISFTLRERSHVLLSIYGADGRLITRLLDETLDAGVKDVTWDGRNAQGRPSASGVYFYRLTAGNQSITRKMVLLK